MFKPLFPMPTLEGNLYQGGKLIGRVSSAVALPLDRTGVPSAAESEDNRMRYLLTLAGYFTVHNGFGPERFEIEPESGGGRIRVYPEDSQSVGGETNVTVTLEQ